MAAFPPGAPVQGLPGTDSARGAVAPSWALRDTTVTRTDLTISVAHSVPSSTCGDIAPVGQRENSQFPKF